MFSGGIAGCNGLRIYLHNLQIKIGVMNLIHICTAWWLSTDMNLLVAKMCTKFVCTYIAYKCSTFVLSTFYTLRKQIVNICEGAPKIVVNTVFQNWVWK